LAPSASASSASELRERPKDFRLPAVDLQISHADAELGDCVGGFVAGFRGDRHGAAQTFDLRAAKANIRAEGLQPDAGIGEIADRLARFIEDSRKASRTTEALAQPTNEIT
jgi:hypothetical protein